MQLTTFLSWLIKDRLAAMVFEPRVADVHSKLTGGCSMHVVQSPKTVAEHLLRAMFKFRRIAPQGCDAAKIVRLALLRTSTKSPRPCIAASRFGL